MADAKALVAVLEVEDDEETLQEALAGITSHLEPLLELRNAGQLSMDTLRPVARAHGPVVTALVKCIGNRLLPNQNYSQEQLLVFGEAASIALYSVDILRPVLKASGHELDVQRYNFVRKLAAYGLHEHAMAQGKVLLASASVSPGTAAGPGELHIAAVANVLVCYAELVKQGSSRADALWKDIHGPLDDLLHLARDAADIMKASKRLDVVLKCLGKVAETWQYASVVCNLTPIAVAQQLSALTACAAICRQEQVIQQVLADDAATAPDTVKLTMMNSLVYLLASDGSLPAPLLPLLHQLFVSLVQKRAGPLHPPTPGPCSGQPLAALLHVAFGLQHCALTGSPDEQLCALLRQLASAAEDLAAGSAELSQHEQRLRWCCLDGLRVSVAGILTQLLSAPQCAGGLLCALSTCMELLCDASLRMISNGDVWDLEAAAPSGTSAVTIAVRIQVTHALCSGQLATLRDDVSRSLGLLKCMLDSSRERATPGAAGGMGPAVLHSLSASLGNAGLDLLQAQHASPAAVLLQAAAELALERARQMRKQGEHGPDTDVSQLIKKCKSHVTALQQLPAHDLAMSAAASYVAQLHSLADDKAHLLWSISKQFVQSSLATYYAAMAAAVAAAPQASAGSGEGSAAVPAAPCKANRRGGRLQRMQTNSQSEDASSQRTAKQATAPEDAGRPAMPSAAVPPPRTLVQLLAAAALERRGWPALLDSLDMYAVQELEVVREEAKRREDDGLQSLYCAAVLDTLSKCAKVADSSDAQRARELLVKSVTFSSALDTQISDLRASCALLDTLLTELPDPAHSLTPSALGILDSAATAHAHLGLCLAQKQLQGRSSADQEAPAGHISQAMSLWGRLLAAHRGSASVLTFRMPQVTLHAALQLQQYVHLHGGELSEAADFSLDVVWRLVRELSIQVKVREQQAYLLSVTMPSTTCTAWVLASQPLVPLAEALADAYQHRKLAEISKITEPVRDVYATGAADHIAVATAAGACATELERSGFLRHGPAPMLLRSQCHQIAAAAYLRAGDTASAYVQAQEALRITCGLMVTLECPPLSLSGTATGNRAAPSASTATQGDLTPAEAAAAAVKSGVATSALDYAADALVQGDVDGGTGYGSDAPNGSHGDEASAPKRKPGRVLSACLAWATAAVHLASLHSAARVFEAAGCVEDATCLWEECVRAAELFNVPAVRFLCRTYLAEISCRRGDGEAAATHLKAADADAGSRALAPGASCVETALLKAHSCAVRARLALLRQQPHQVQDTAQEGIAACNAGLESGHTGQTGRDGQGETDGLERRHGALVWHGVCLRVHLQRLHAEALLQLGRRQEAVGLLQSALAQLQQAAAAAACSRRSVADIWPADYGLTLAHLAAAAAPAASPACRGAATLVGLTSASSVPCDGKLTRAQPCASVASDTTDMSATSDQSSKKGNKAKACSSSPCKARAQCPQRQGQQSDAVSTDSVDLLSSMPSLLQSLRICWQLPLAAVYACRQLLHASITLGLPYAAMMFLHLGHGMSYARQQALQREWRRNAASQRSGAHAEEAAESTADGEVGCSSTHQGSALAADVHEAALAVLMGLNLEGDATGTEPLASLESGAKAWLLRALDVLPPDAVVSTLVQDDQGEGLLVGRVARGGAPLLVVLHGLDAGTAGRQPERAAGASVGSVLDRCTARLRQLLDESGDSMHMDQDAASSQSHKAKWWKTRVSLDNSVKGLLQDLDEQCLGPWRCLLLPMPTAHLSVWREAADAFIGEHLSSALAEHPCSRVHSRMAVLRELFTVTLSGMRHLQTGDIAALLDLVCSQLGLSAGRASSLAMELAAAEAAARVQFLKLRPAEPSRGSEPAGTADLPNADASPGRGQVGRCAAPAGPRAASARTATGGSARARPGVASGSVQGSTASSRTGLREVTRRTGAAPPGGAPEPMDTENLPPQPAAAAAAADARGRRTTRATAAQPEASSSQSAASKVAARAASTRLGTRTRAGVPAVVEDQPAENKKADAQRGAHSGPATQEAASVSGRTGSVAEAGEHVLRDRGPVLLVLSPALHALPWESIPCFQGCELYRILSLPAACAAAAAAAQPSAAAPAGAASESSETGSKGAGGCGPGLAAGPSAFYVLNPNGDLMDTQRCFQPILEAQPLWEGIIGLRPSAEVLLAALQTRDLFLYFGHGSGEQFLPLPALRKLHRCATCLLMGCSSGRFRLHGAYDPSGAAVAYLLAGCPALVANLWDVTDRDIDRYCQALMHAWLGCDVSQPAGDNGSGAAGTRSEMPSSSRLGSESLGVAVARSRVACKLTHLIGAAPVCYGLPQWRAGS